MAGVISRDVLEELIFGRLAGRRYTQDSPVLPDVWMWFGGSLDKRLDLLLSPSRGFTPTALAKTLGERLLHERTTAGWRDRHGGHHPSPSLSLNETHVVAELSLDEVLRVALPLTQWWDRHAFTKYKLNQFHDPNVRGDVAAELDSWRAGRATGSDLVWLVQLIGYFEVVRVSSAAPLLGNLKSDELVEAFSRLMLGTLERTAQCPELWSMSRNRDVNLAMWRSVGSTKADAACRLFQVNCSRLCWAIVDSGVDARHVAFRKRQPASTAIPRQKHSAAFEVVGHREVNNTRVRATYDFTRLRRLLALDAGGGSVESGPAPGMDAARVASIRQGLLSGRSIDWGELEPLLKVPHTQAGYLVPQHDHGTHVAGVLAADWRAEDVPSCGVPEEALVGLCPDIEFYDLRVLDDQGKGDEFAVLAALQFIRWLNTNKDEPVVHGVNISLSLLHDVANYACGRTPVCEECDRLTASGAVVVAAAGNEGYMQFETARGRRDGYRSISITDPGNADSVITVGATHRFKPHTYGVSYFSSRGPTGDGRMKPDLVAPGEKIKSTVPEDKSKSMDGTSMAAPHVSGAAALLMARHAELKGDPERIKDILCRTATDLKRERFFQGSGMVDVLRALQSV